MYFPAFVRTNGECHPDVLDMAYRSIGATAVDPWHLSPALNYDSSFHCVVSFDLGHPFGPDDFLIRES